MISYCVIVTPLPMVVQVWLVNRLFQLKNVRRWDESVYYGKDIAQ